MMKLKNFFDRIVIINLPERIDRKQAIIKELEGVGCSLDDQVTFFPAIKPSSSAGFPCVGAHGCFLSHEAVINQALKDNVQRLLILEDDLLLPKSFNQYEQTAINEVNGKNWGFLYLGHFVPEKQYPPHIQTFDQSLLCAHFFALNQPVLQPLSAYLKAIKERSPGDPKGGPMHVDGAYNRFRAEHPHYPTLICYPSLGIQRSSKSDIAENKWHDTLPIFREVVNYFRSIKNWLKSK